MEDAVTKQHAHPNTVLHCLYGFYNLGYSRKELARIYNKSGTTIGNWIRVYEASGTFERAGKSSERKFSAAHRSCLRDYYAKHPLSYLDEVQDAFVRAHNITISKSSVWRIIHEFGLTWKVLERRAMHIKERDIFRFVEELAQIDWCHLNLVFLDEVSFDNRGMIRKRGYFVAQGTKLAIRGDFQRKSRVLILAFIGVRGIIDYFDTQGTFDRIEFVNSCRDFAYAKRNMTMY